MAGALCDNLTSAGGNFWVPKPDSTAKRSTLQTLCVEFLHQGAAGASGAVVEPYAIQAKFPLPALHVHYARGCSMAEAFYQSVSGPFQLLIVGDPLCQPWAEAPVVEVEGIADTGTVAGEVEITPTAKLPGVKGVGHFELLVDGLRTQQCKPGESFRWDTAALADGMHDVRVVAVDDSPIEVQGRWMGQITVKNGRDALGLRLKPEKRVSASEHLTVTATSTSTETVTVMHNGRVLGQIRGGSGSLRIDAGELGRGPVSIEAKTDAGPGLRSRPMRIIVF